jgi:hypothetical protein
VVVTVGIDGTRAAKSERDNDLTPCRTGRDEHRLAQRFCFGVVKASDDPAASLNQLPLDHRRIVERERRSRRPVLRPMHTWVRDAGVPTQTATAAITRQLPAGRRSHDAGQDQAHRHGPPHTDRTTTTLAKFLPAPYCSPTPDRASKLATVLSNKIAAVARRIASLERGAS